MGERTLSPISSVHKGVYAGLKLGSRFIFSWKYQVVRLSVSNTQCVPEAYKVLQQRGNINSTFQTTMCLSVLECVIFYLYISIVLLGKEKGRGELHTLERMDSESISFSIGCRLLFSDSYSWKVDLGFGNPAPSHNRHKSD